MSKKSQTPFNNYVHIYINNQFFYMRSILKLKQFYTTSIERKVFLALTDKNLQSEILNNPNKQKLDLLAQGIFNFKSRQLSYFKWLVKEQGLKNNQNIVDLTIESYQVDENIDKRSYFLQQQKIKNVWPTQSQLFEFVYKNQTDMIKQEVKVEVKAKQIFDVELTTVNAADKIKIIKVIREVLGLGLKQAKQLVQKTPVVVKQAKKDQAQKLAEVLMKGGCNITIK